MIVVERLRKQFGSTVAVDDVSFHVKQGEIIGLLGPNGSGKTTIMRILTGFFPPTSGRARVGGLDVESESIRVRRLIGYLPESVVLYPDIPVARYLRFCGEVKDLRGAKLHSRIEAVIQAVGLGEVRKREIGKLSKGYRQRVGLAQALIAEPALLILDEPTVGLDPIGRNAVWERLRRLRDEFGTTIFLSTHAMDEADALCDRLAILSRGNVVIVGSPRELKAGLDIQPATLEDVFLRYAGTAIESAGSYRDVKRTRRTAQRVG
jgi:ABC-2 type transport system ATP-binding protein